MSDNPDIHPHDLPEMALGIEDPSTRPELLAHLARCGPCREELAALADVSDRLAALAPAAEPEVGFEQRVLDRVAGLATHAGATPQPAAASRPYRRWSYGPGRSGERGGRHRRAVLAAAALAAAAVVAVLVLVPSSPRREQSWVKVATLTASSGPVGDVVWDYGPNPWLSMAVTAWPDRAVICQVVTADGAVITIGEFTTGAHGGYWAAAVPRSGAPARIARLVDTSGRVLATARLR
ncbi:MAG: hypothetical protein KGQ66_02940 [Acidobacteriota bacterium]|nr:hypothetical protein [Acidobacteriota bacterium]